MNQYLMLIGFYLSVAFVFFACSSEEENPVTPNNAPTISVQTFTTLDDITDTDVIGTVKATDSDGDELSFSITTNAGNLFEITTDGALSLATGQSLDANSATSHNITIEVTDGSASASAVITINVTGSNTVPVISAQTFTVAEDIMESVIIGMVMASDADGDDLAFSISSNDNGLFSITDGGELTLATGMSLDFETTASHSITVAVTDGMETVSANITIEVTDVDEADPTAFIFQVQVATNQEVKLPFPSGSLAVVDFTVDWGDGTAPNAAFNHVYQQEGDYNITLSPTKNRITFRASSSAPNTSLVDILQWGSASLSNDGHQFSYCTELENFTANDEPNLSNITNCGFMFFGATKFNGNISGWDVSNVENMYAMFSLCTAFNQDIGAWDVSNVTTMYRMFNGCTAFNQDIGSWDISNVTALGYAFNACVAFNQDIGNWNTSNVTNMLATFNGCTTFNQDLSNWNVSKVIDMSGLFSSCKAFNQDLSSWDVSNVKSIRQMFFRCTAFNQPLSAWNVSSVTDFSGMFSGCTLFDQDISAWDVSSGTNMNTMFSDCTSFDQNISSWDVSSVENTSLMFNQCTKFNQDLSSWDVGSVTNMNFMFKSATAFSQDLSGWNTTNVTNCSNFANDSGLTVSQLPTMGNCF